MDKLFDSFATVRKSATVLASSSDKERKEALIRIAEALSARKAEIFRENSLYYIMV